MYGPIKLEISNQDLIYRFELKRKITVLRGDSGTGKSVLASMAAMAENSNRGINLKCDKQVVVFKETVLRHYDEYSKDTVIIIDEDVLNRLGRRAIAEFINKSSNFYLLITRKKLSEFSLSVTEIYRIKKGFEKGSVLNTFESIYTSDDSKIFKPEVIIIEDSGAGFELYSILCNKNIKCVSAKGKDNIRHMLRSEEHRDSYKLVVADGAAFGPEIEEVMVQKNLHGNIGLYLPESFEYILLSTKMFEKNQEIRRALNDLYGSISSEYNSYERYFTELISKVTAMTPAKYSKASLNKCYVNDCCYRGSNEKCVFNTRYSKIDNLKNLIKCIDFGHKGDVKDVNS
jgi:hypothetical protein